MKVLCDRCSSRFEANVQEFALEDGGARISFSCNVCGTVYPVARFTALGLRIRNELQETSDPAQHLRLRKRLDREVTDERSG